MELIKNFGIDPVYLGAQIVNFLIILYFLKRFLYKPVFQMLKKRENEIKGGLEKTESARKLLEKTMQEEKIILRKAQNQAVKIVEDAKSEVIEINRLAEESSKKRAEQIIFEAREQIVRETKEAEERLSAHVSRLAIAFLQKALPQIFTENEQKEVIEKAVRKLKEKPN